MENIQLIWMQLQHDIEVNVNQNPFNYQNENTELWLNMLLISWIKLNLYFRYM